jgi:hypothetical protein
MAGVLAERHGQDRSDEAGEERQCDEQRRRRAVPRDCGEAAERAHPAVSKPPGADSSKSGFAGRFGAAVGAGRGCGAGRAGAALVLVGAGVAGGDAGALVGVAALVAAGSGAGGALVAGTGVVGAGGAAMVAAARSSTTGRRRRAGAALRVRRVGACSRPVGAAAAGSAGSALRGGAPATTA